MKEYFQDWPFHTQRINSRPLRWWVLLEVGQSIQSFCWFDSGFCRRRIRVCYKEWKWGFVGGSSNSWFGTRRERWWAFNGIADTCRITGRISACTFRQLWNVKENLLLTYFLELPVPLPVKSFFFPDSPDYYAKANETEVERSLRLDEGRLEMNLVNMIFALLPF